MFENLDYSELKKKLYDAIETRDGQTAEKIIEEINERIKKYE